MIIVHTYEYKGCIKIPLAPCYPYKSMLVDPEDNILSPWYFPVHPANQHTQQTLYANSKTTQT